MNFIEYNFISWKKVESQSGLTLIEILIGLSLFSVIFLISISFYSSLHKKIELSIIVEEIKGAIQFAKLEAMIEGENLVLAPIFNSKDWSEGIILFVDNKEHKYLANSKIIHEWHWGKSKVHVSWKGFQSSNYLLFSNELSRMAVNGNFIIKNLIGGQVKLIVNRIGRVKVSNSL